MSISLGMKLSLGINPRLLKVIRFSAIFCLFFFAKQGLAVDALSDSIRAKIYVAIKNKIHPEVFSKDSSSPEVLTEQANLTALINEVLAREGLSYGSLGKYPKYQIRLLVRQAQIETMGPAVRQDRRVLYSQAESPTTKRFMEIQQRYLYLGYDFDRITEYRARRVIPLKDFKPTPLKGKKAAYLPWEMLKPSPGAWNKWEVGDFFRSEMKETIEDEIVSSPISRWTLTRRNLDLFRNQVAQEKKSFWRRSSDSGFTQVMTLDEKKYFESTAPNDLLGYDGKPMVQSTFRLRRDGNYDAKFTYMSQERANQELDRFLVELSAGMNYFTGWDVSQLSDSKKWPHQKENSIQFAARMQRKFAAIHPYKKDSLQISRFLQDMIHQSLGLPYVPAASLPNPITTPLARYQFQTEEFVESQLGLLESCIRELEIANLSKVSPRCRPIYEWDNPSISDESSENRKKEQARIREDVVEEACHVEQRPFAQDLSTLLGDVYRAGLGGLRSENEFENINLSDDEKRKIIEELATPLAEDLVTYSWVNSASAGFSRENFYPRNWLFKLMLGKKSKVDPGSKMAKGKAFYVSKNIFDSSRFALKNKDIYKIQKFFDRYRSQVDGFRGIENPTPAQIQLHQKQLAQIVEETAAFARENSNKESRLYRVVIKKDQKVFDYKKHRNVLTRLGISERDISELNPNVVIDYSSKKKRESDTPSSFDSREWFAIKLRDPKAFTVQRAHRKDFSTEQINQMKYEFGKNTGSLLGGFTEIGRILGEPYR